jgi:DNA sulfur modification protein DndC
MDKTQKPSIGELIERGALFVCNHSGGKDSQAMYLKLKALVPAEQLVVVHAHLPDVEWDGVREHIASTITSPYYECRAGKTFLEMVETRGMWPSAKYRQCTSDLKRNPLVKLIRQLSRDMNRPLIVNCMGMRAQESPARAKKSAWTYSETNSKAGREWYEWLPIHDLTVEQVFGSIEANGQQPHWAYAAGMSRLSCCFCIMSSDADLRTAASLRPDLLATFVALEEKIGHTFRAPKKNGDAVPLSCFGAAA